MRSGRDAAGGARGAFETLLTRLLRIGFSGPFSAEEARSLQQLREQRGL